MAYKCSSIRLQVSTAPAQQYRTPEYCYKYVARVSSCVRMRFRACPNRIDIVNRKSKSPVLIHCPQKRLFVRPMTMETRCSKVFFPNYSKRNRLKILLSYRRYGEHGGKKNVFPGLFVHTAVRGGTCAFTLKIVNTLIKNSSRDDRHSIST